jgi:hypothetical protein
MKTFIITEYPQLIRKWKVVGKNKKQAYENWLTDKIEFIQEDYDDNVWERETIKEVK